MLRCSVGGGAVGEGVTLRDKEAGRVETGLDGGGGVNHPRLVDPLKGTFLWMPLDGIERVTIS